MCMYMYMLMYIYMYMSAEMTVRAMHAVEGELDQRLQHRWQLVRCGGLGEIAARQCWDRLGGDESVCSVWLQQSSRVSHVVDMFFRAGTHLFHV